jgi:hypothetical protein
LQGAQTYLTIVHERQTAIRERVRVSVRELAGVRACGAAQAALSATLTVEGFLAAEKNARIEVGWLLTAATHVAGCRGGAEQEHQ